MSQKIHAENHLKMKNTITLLFLILFLLPSLYASAQKKYFFDHILEYSFYRKGTSDTVNIFFLTNSQNNAYQAKFWNQDNTYLAFELLDQNGIFSQFKMRKRNFENTTSINLSCENVDRFANPYKYQVKNYAFFIQNDTLINKRKYSHYTIKCTRSKKYIKRKALGVTHFIVDKSISYHLPFFTHQTEYEEWKTSKNIPYGIPKEKYHVNLDGSLEYKYTLVDFKKIEKTIIVPEECNYVD